MLISASKKGKDFKVVLKRKYFNSDLSIVRNISNGCEHRIPPDQWETLVRYWKTDNAKAKSDQLKANRATQENRKHTTGSRSFAYVLDQKELKEGIKVGRAELYSITHTKKDGTPVDMYSGAKMTNETGDIVPLVPGHQFFLSSSHSYSFASSSTELLPSRCLKDANGS